MKATRRICAFQISLMNQYIQIEYLGIRINGSKNSGDTDRKLPAQYL